MTVRFSIHERTIACDVHNVRPTVDVLHTAVCITFRAQRDEISMESNVYLTANEVRQMIPRLEDALEQLRNEVPA